jgi:hypothetical protein
MLGILPISAIGTFFAVFKKVGCFLAKFGKRKKFDG